MRAAIYLRISQDATGEARGVARQLEDCAKLADGLGWDVAEVYTDNDISATSGKTRPAYKKMLADIEAGQIDALVIWSPDRLYRRTADLETLIPVIEAHNVLVRTVKAGDLDLSTAYGRMIARILGAIATGEGEVKAERWKRSWRQGREAGEPAKTGSRLFGYTRDGQVIPEEKAITERMVADLLAGVTLHQIARWLCAEEIPTTRGSIWRPSTVRQYLANPRIAGWSTLNGEVVAEGTWEPLIDRAAWENIRALLQSRTRAKPPRKALLNGLVHCSLCEHRMLTGSAGAKRSYRCSSRPGWGGCGSISVLSGPVEEIVEEYAKALLDRPEIRERIHQLQAQPSGIQGEIAEIEMRLKELEHQLDEPGVPVTTILRAIERAKDRQNDLLGSLAAVPRVPLPTSRAEWPDDLRRRRALVDLVVARVDIKPSTGGNRFNPERVQIVPR